MQGWTYSGGFRINKGIQGDKQMFFGSVVFNLEKGMWSYQVMSKHEGSYAITVIAQGLEATARLCLESANAILEEAAK